MSESMWPHRWQPTRLPRPWDSPGKNTGVGCHFLLQKKAECQRIDAFKWWCWRRLLSVPWTAGSNQPILKGINPEYSLQDWCWSWSSNTLVIWCEDLTHWKRSWWKTEGEREEGGSITDSTDLSLTKHQGIVEDTWYVAVHGVAKSQTQLSNWTTTTLTE